MRPLLGTFVEIEADGVASRVPEAIDAAFAAVERMQRLMSFHEAASDVSRINAARAGEHVRVDEETFTVLRAARIIGDRSAGAFDIATAPVLVRSGLLPEIPGVHCSAAALGATYRDLELLPAACVRWRRKGCIDLGGIAKGYAVDRAIETLRAYGVERGLVNAGGDLRCFGGEQPLFVRSAHDPGSVVPVGSIRDAAAATSAGYFSPRPRTHPLVDPTRRACIDWDCSVTVVADDCMTADALTKVIALAPHRAARVLERFDAQAIILGENGARACGRARLEEAAA